MSEVKQIPGRFKAGDRVRDLMLADRGEGVVVQVCPRFHGLPQYLVRFEDEEGERPRREQDLEPIEEPAA